MRAMKTFLKAGLLLFFALAFGPFSKAQDTPGFLEPFNFENPAATTWSLPKELKDISGLATSPDGRLFALENERAIIHEIDFVEGTIIKTFSFGRPAAKKDFTGLAIAGKRFFVINPKGLLLEGREGFNYEGKVFNAYDSGFGKTCKIQGLAAIEGKLLGLCGDAEDKAYKGFLTILSWDIAAKKGDGEPFLQIPWGGEDFPADLLDFSPSGLEVMETGNVLILSSSKKMVLEITRDGEIVSYRILNKKAHDGPVGLAVTHNGQIIIADKGSPATIQVYEK